MIFTLEAVQAKYGDCLIVHFGGEPPKFIVIDGGPAGVYKPFLKKRLLKIKQRWSTDDPLPIELLMLSHIDEDHIRGLLELTEDLAQMDRTEKPPYQIQNLWQNTFDDIIGNRDPKLASVLAEIVKPVGAVPASLVPESLVLASVAQGQELRDNANKLRLLVNDGFDGFVCAPATGGKTVPFDDLRITILGPRRDRLDALQVEWDKKLKEIAKQKEKAETAAIQLDTSPYNLSSIICLAEFGTGADAKSMLLTGDGLCDDILSGLERAKKLKDGSIHVDILKLPHHGSDRNVTTPFFRQVKADHYVISANGKFDNPDIPTLKMISEARGREDFTLHLTNHDGEKGLAEKLDAFEKAERAEGKTYKIEYRTDALSMRIDLLAKTDY